MDLTKRVQLITMLEKILIQEASLSFVTKNRKQFDFKENSVLTDVWHNYSQTFTRMWLNYLPDDELQEILTKKMADSKSSGSTNTLFGSI